MPRFKQIAVHADTYDRFTQLVRSLSARDDRDYTQNEVQGGTRPLLVFDDSSVM